MCPYPTTRWGASADAKNKGARMKPGTLVFALLRSVADEVNQGVSTVSITWTMPLAAVTSVAMTRALPTKTSPSMIYTVSLLPFTVGRSAAFTTSLADSRPGTT